MCSWVLPHNCQISVQLLIFLKKVEFLNCCIIYNTMKQFQLYPDYSYCNSPVLYYFGGKKEMEKLDD